MRHQLKAGGLAGIVLCSVVLLAPAASAATGTVQTGGLKLAVRSGPGTGYGVVRWLDDRSAVNIGCQTSGDTVNGNWGPTNVWDNLGDGYASDGFVYTGSNGRVAPACGGSNSRGDQAINWYASRNGSTAYEWWCEQAAENAYGANGAYASAIAHWQAMLNNGHAHPGDMNPPRGAFVYWNIAPPYGHVGVADGSGGFWATNVNGHIGHASLPHFSNYLGWSDVTF
jgi:uncharacterized protein YraI